jgi:hypothetical protein
MRRALLVAALAFAPPLAVLACSSESAPQPPGPIPAEDLRAEVEAAQCEFLVRCTWMPDAATCSSVDGADYELLQLLADVSSGKVEYDAQAGRAWVEATREQPCNSTFAAMAALEAAYDAAFLGTIALDGPCFVDQECVAGAMCDRAACQDGPECCAGTCVARPVPVPIGGDCSMGACEDAAWCDPAGGDMGSGPTCAPRVGNGQACVDELSCQDGLLCGSGQCYRLSPQGAPCNPSLSTSCLDYSNWCDPAQNECVLLPAAGEPCGTSGAGCQLYAYCDGATCQPRPKEGEPCFDSGPQCLGDLRCQDDVCVANNAVEVCIGDGNPPDPGTGGGGGSGGGG